MNNVSPQFRVLEELHQIDREERFRNLIVNFFSKRNSYLTYLKHGVIEKGVDIVMLYDKYDDVLLRGQLFLFQVKIKDIDTSIWRKNLHSQLLELYYAPLDIPPYNSIELSRRIILITTGTINGYVKEKISDINKRHLNPIEYLEGHDVAVILTRKQYDIQELREDLDDTTYVKSPQ